MLPSVTVRAQVRSSANVAGDGLLHPVPLAAIGLLILNDHVLKEAFPGFLTGKLSDFCGLVFFPLFLQAVWEVGTWIRGRQRIADRRVLLTSVVATGVVFSSIKLVPGLNEFVSRTLGMLQWLAGQIPVIVSGAATATPMPVEIALDPTDLIALPALGVAYLFGARRARSVAV
jgi:hypothetical protein